MSDVASFAEYVAQYPNARQFLTLGASNGLLDQTGNGRDGTAVGGITVGGATGPGDLGATQFDGVDDAIATAYNPFSNGEVKTFFGWAWRDNSAALHTLFSSDATGNRPLLQLTAAAPATPQFFTDRGLGAVSWPNAWAGNAQWVSWMLRVDPAALQAELWIGSLTAPPVSQGVKTLAAGYNATPGNIQYGCGGSGLLPWAGRQAFVGLVRGDATPDAVTFWSWGLSTAASRSPDFGLPSPNNFPSQAQLPTGDDRALEVY